MNIFLFVIGAAIVYGLQLICCKLIWNRNLSANVVFSERQVKEGDNVNLTVTVENRKAFPVLTVKVNMGIDRGLEFQDKSNLAISDRNYRSEIFSMKGYERVQREIPLFCAKRGYYQVQEVDFVGNDLFYTRRFLMNQEVNTSLCVYPGKSDARQLMLATQKMMGETVVRQSDCTDPFTFRGIREYQNYDNVRDINWKASARVGDLRVNIHDFTADQEIAIVLDTEWDTLVRPEGLLEESIRIAASMAEEFIAHGILTSLRSNGLDCISGEMFSIDAGANENHNNAIGYGLARIRLITDKELKCSSILPILEEETERMDAQPNRKISWVFISTETNARVVNQWSALRERAIKSYWIIPAYSSNEIPPELMNSPEVMYWEVPYGK